MEKLEFEKEKVKLEQTINIIKEILQDEKLDLKNLYNNGFAGGLVAGFLLPILDAFVKRR